MQIGFNKPYFTGKETDYIKQAVRNMHISGDGIFTKKCHQFFENKYHFRKCLLTTSCTDALEMAAILLDTKEGDEIIMPAFTFVSTANAFVLRGAKILFADSQAEHPNICTESISRLISPKTKALVVVHYAGVACDMEQIAQLCKENNVYLIEDAAQAVDSYYQRRPLGSFGDLAAFSFHETKNVIAGEGGMLVINNEKFIQRAEIIREKGTNRSAFFRGEVDKYSWVDIGSSFLPSEITAAFLYAQLESLEVIQAKRKKNWTLYSQILQEGENKGFFQLPKIPSFAQHNAHLFYLTCKSLEERSLLIKYLKDRGIQAVFHYISLHQSEFFKKYQPQNVFHLPNSDKFTDTLLRLPLFFELNETQQQYICETIMSFYGENC
ncbi:MAG: dTDP-4-amino-4,6-dideoxygalactose transaminase [Raineya sp.]